MKIKLSAGFRQKLAKQVEYIAQDKPQASRDFKNDLFNEIGKYRVILIPIVSLFFLMMIISGI